jgi:hypothetical protein
MKGLCGQYNFQSPRQTPNRELIRTGNRSRRHQARSLRLGRSQRNRLRNRPSHRRKGCCRRVERLL